MKNILIISLALILANCSTKINQDKEYYYILNQKEALKSDTINNTTPQPLPVAFYGQHNFILVDTTHVFYHNNFVYYMCGMGIDFSKPPRLFLAADSLTEININSLQSFLSKNVKDTVMYSRYVSVNISSSTDTIKSIAFKIIVDHLKKLKIKRYCFRNWTEEENFASTSKIENTMYDPKTATFKIGFDTEFTPLLDKVKIE